jgi:hypothetical protein
MPLKGSKTSAASRIAANSVMAINGCQLWLGSVSTQGGYAMCADDDGQMDLCLQVASASMPALRL